MAAYARQALGERMARGRIILEYRSAPQLAVLRMRPPLNWSLPLGAAVRLIGTAPKRFWAAVTAGELRTTCEGFIHCHDLARFPSRHSRWLTGTTAHGVPALEVIKARIAGEDLARVAPHEAAGQRYNQTERQSDSGDVRIVKAE